MAQLHRDCGCPTNFIEGDKLKGYIFKFVWLQDICKSKMAAFKSFINTIDMISLDSAA